MRVSRFGCIVLLSFLSQSPGATLAGSCLINNSPRYQLATDVVEWSMHVVVGQTCTAGVRFANVILEDVKLVSLPQAGEATLRGLGFTYAARSDFQGQDRFAIEVSGSINKRRGSSTIHVTVLVEAEPTRVHTQRRDNPAAQVTNTRTPSITTTPFSPPGPVGNAAPSLSTSKSASTPTPSQSPAPTPSSSLSRFPVGTWVNITPPVVATGSSDTCIGGGVTIDPKIPGTIYWSNGPYNFYGGEGLWKSTNYGVTWRRIASVQPIFSGASNYLDQPLEIRIDPNDSNHLYVNDGVRGTSQGFFVSHDGGETFVRANGFDTAITNAGINTEDTHEAAVDPTDFNHVLVSFHSAWGWTDTKWNTNSGILETTDGGMTWKVIPPVAGWGSGHSIKFLYEPSLGIGNSRTWLLGTQVVGLWRTTDGGDTWTQVSTTSITHGGNGIYYARNGTLYTGGLQTMRSTDNGATWTRAGPVQGSSTVFGDGTFLYTAGAFASNTPIQVSSETDGLNWTSFNNQPIADGPFKTAFDAKHGLIFSSAWSTGLWVLRPR
jgi:hypothetical protein